MERLTPLDLDGLVLYDIDDESVRNPVERPFPFSPTVDPSEYRAEHLQEWRTPAVVYAPSASTSANSCERGSASRIRAEL